MSKLNDLDSWQAEVVKDGDEKQNCCHCIHNRYEEEFDFVYCALSNWDNDINHETLIEVFQEANDITETDYGYNCTKYEPMVMQGNCPATGIDFPPVEVRNWKHWSIDGIALIDEDIVKQYNQIYLKKFSPDYKKF